MNPIFRCRRSYLNPTPASVWLILFVLIVGVAPGLSKAEEKKSSWELGAGIGAISFPDYPGSNQQHSRFFPVPYVRYKGKHLNVDDDGVYSEIFSSDRLTLRISLGVGLPAKSKQNGARTGMPNLDPTLEIGPSIQIALSETDTHTVSLQLPVRAVIATDLRHTEPLGWIFAPQIKLSWDKGPWSTNVYAGPVYASEGYHDYYYEVDPVYATPTRPAYDAKAGFNGNRSTVTVTRRFDSYWLGLFASYHDLSRAEIRDSPLVKQESSFTFGVALAWVFAESS